MKRAIEFNGTPLKLIGRNIKELTYAPNFKVLSSDFKEVTLDDFEDKIKVITSFPSLDTPVCDLQVKEFNKKTQSLSNDIIIVGISKDLPFAQKRFCDEFSINHVLVFSDYKYSSFGINYGLLIKELNLLARAVIILDEKNIIRYIQIIDELSNQPNYDEVLKNIEEILKNRIIDIVNDPKRHCIPCEGTIKPLSKNIVSKQLATLNSWDLIDDNKITKVFKTKDYEEAKYLLNIISLIADEQGHHPTLSLMWNKLKVSLTTHAASGLTDNDFIMAHIIDEIAGD